MAVILITAQECLEEVQVGEAVGVMFNCTGTEFSPRHTQEQCCSQCTAPVIVSDLHEGDTLIPFSLNMSDSTEVYLSYAGSVFSAIIHDGKGVIDTIEPLVEGESILISVSQPSCSTQSAAYIVKPKPESNCDCSISSPCNILINNIEYVVEGSEARISKLEISATGDLKYRIDSGEWLSDWTLLNIFSLKSEHYLEIKMAKQPRCKISLPIIVLEKIIIN